MDAGSDRRQLAARRAFVSLHIRAAMLAMLCALNRPHELKTHVRGALANGATREEIREVFMQVAIYCGVPAGVDAFRNAKEVFAELDKK